MKEITYTSIIILFFCLLGCDVNEIPTTDERVKSSWSEVQNQYQRRADLIPNLVSITKKAGNNEKETLTSVINTRNKLFQYKEKDLLSNKKNLEEYQNLQGDLGGHLQQLFLQVERYPTLQSNQNFIQLSSQVEGTENRIALARREFIFSIEAYNTALKTYPGKLYHQYLYSEYQPRTDPVYFKSSNQSIISIDFK